MSEQNFPRKGSFLWALATGDWRGMNLRQIAVEMGCTADAVRSSIRKLKTNYQIEIDYDSRPVREMDPVPDDLETLSPHCALWKLIHQDWSDYTLTEAAKELHKNSQGVKLALEELERKHGITVPLKAAPPPQKMAGYKKQLDNSRRCRTCFYWNATFRCCDYLEIMRHRRPCPPGYNCTEYKRPRTRRRGISF